VPRALAIETSGRIGSIALAENSTILAEEPFEHGLQNAAKILPIIDRMCRARNWIAKDLEDLYISIGPGSFTGLRIGVTLCKTIAFATGAKICAVPSVRVLAENAPLDARHLIIVLDAKRDQIFTARLERSADGWREVETAHLDSLTDMLARAPRPIHLLGEGVPYHQKFIPTDASIIVTHSELWRARASVVARLGYEMSVRGEFCDPYRLAPMYIRRPEAEEKADRAADR
jgi:tRNA threonylcarbamoyladenosine biosynthesis protein TsaB